MPPKERRKAALSVLAKTAACAQTPKLFQLHSQQREPLEIGLTEELTPDTAPHTTSSVHQKLGEAFMHIL